MLPRAPARLRPSIPLRALVPLAPSNDTLGVWLSGCCRPVAIRVRSGRRGAILLASDDLGLLVARCTQVALGDGPRVVRVPSRILIEWRVLEIALGAPYLPTAEQLRALFPTAGMREGVLVVPIGVGPSEEALGICAAERLPVVASRISYVPYKR